MVNPINTLLASTNLFGSVNNAGAPQGVGSDVLAAWAGAKAGLSNVDTSSVGADPNAPLAPVWQPGLTPNAAALAERALNGKLFFDTTAKLYTDLGASGDYRKLFAVHTGLATLQALVTRMGDASLSPAQKKATQAQFDRGMAELAKFFNTETFEDVRLAQGDRFDAAKTTLAVPSSSEDYVTGIVQRGSLVGSLPGLDPNAKFDVVALPVAGAERRVTIDLSEMGSLPRSLGNVVAFVNNKLSTAGVSSRLETVNQTPKTMDIVVGGKVKTVPFTGTKTYALKVDVRAGERVAFEPIDAEPAFYTITQGQAGARLIKLTDTGGDAGLPAWLQRPEATVDAVGAASGFLGAGAPYSTAPASAVEKLTPALVSDGANNFETKLRAAGEAVLKLAFADGRQLAVTTAWRAGDLQTWRIRSGETSDKGMLDDLAERLTQLLHEQGVAAGVDVWENGDDAGFSIRTGDGVAVSSLVIGGRDAALTDGAAPTGGIDGGLRAGVFARRFEAAGIVGATEEFEGLQSFVFTTVNGTKTITIDAGVDGIDAAIMLSRLQDRMKADGIKGVASFVDVGGDLTLRVDGLHDLLDVTGSINGDAFNADLQAPGAWASGGLPNAAAGEPFADAIRGYIVSGGSPLLTHAGDLDISIVVATATGNRTINVAVTAGERALDPDPAPGEWSATFQARLDAALNAAGVYVAADGADLTHWKAAEGWGQRIQSITINGDTQTLAADAPALGAGGAFSAERSFTSALAATAVNDDVAALISNQNLSIAFDTIWGTKTVNAALDPGDPRTLESAALRLNEALAAAGYDVGVEATALAGGGAGFKLITGDSHTVRSVNSIALGAASLNVTLDPIDAVSHADDPVGAARVAARAARGAAVTETNPNAAAYAAPGGNATAFFPGRAFDVAIGEQAKVATARAVAAGGDGSVYVLADLDGDSATMPIKGARDVALLKYDSAGKLLFTRVLGATDKANGYALAVSADGKVAVAGSVEGTLTGTQSQGGADSVVAVYDASGAELWKARRGASLSDEVRAISFAPDGSVIVAGKTDSALGPVLGAGGADAYVRGYSANGTELFTKQFGSAGADSATALLVRSDGASGIEIITGGVEDNRGVIRRFTYSSSAGFAAGATRDIGYFHKGSINALVADGSSLYVGGEIGADRLTLGAPARGAVAGQEGFVARLDAGLVSTALDRASYIGSSGDDAVNGLAVHGGDVYASGLSGGVMAAQGQNLFKASFVSRLSDDGGVAWLRSFASGGGVGPAVGLAVDTSGASALDVLGLPRGVVASNDPGTLVKRSALKAGDEFQIGAEGRRGTTITIAANDTMGSLLAKISRAVGAAGRAEIVKENGAERIKITAIEGRAINITPGRAGRDALGGLGLSAGVVAVNTATRGSIKTFGLGLVAADLKLDTKEQRAKSNAEISAAISMVRQAYEALVHPNAKPKTEAELALEAKKASAGAAPSYLTAQLANYQAALARLSSG